MFENYFSESDVFYRELRKQLYGDASMRMLFTHACFNAL